MSFDAAVVVDDITRTAARLGKTCGVVAFSGGLDSTVLLHALAQQRHFPIRAVHIDHGLQGVQPTWRARVSECCDGLNIALSIVELNLAPARGESVEAVAREARYNALAGDIGNDELLLLAQHRDDQAETLLLQLLRGAGPAGLSAMPGIARIGQSHLMRPLLDVSRQSLLDYATDANISWFDDPSNADTRFDRNYLRNEVMPGIARRWPGASKTLARAARLQSEASRILQQQAAVDARRIKLQHARLSIPALLELPNERQANVLRFALSAMGLASPPSRRMAGILAMCAGDSGRGEVRWAAVSVRRYRDTLFLLPTLPPEPDDQIALPIGGDGNVELPAGLGQMHVSGTASLATQTLVVRFRRGGERVRETATQPSRSLAQWFQSRGVPPWERSRTPMLFAGDTLVAIGESTLTGECPEAQGLRINWLR